MRLVEIHGYEWRNGFCVRGWVEVRVAAPVPDEESGMAMVTVEEFDIPPTGVYIKNNMVWAGSMDSPGYWCVFANAIRVVDEDKGRSERDDDFITDRVAEDRRDDEVPKKSTKLHPSVIDGMMNTRREELRRTSKHLKEAIGWVKNEPSAKKSPKIQALVERSEDAVELMEYVEKEIWNFQNQKAIEAVKDLW